MSICSFPTIAVLTAKAFSTASRRFCERLARPSAVNIFGNPPDARAWPSRIPYPVNASMSGMDETNVSVKLFAASFQASPPRCRSLFTAAIDCCMAIISEPAAVRWDAILTVSSFATPLSTPFMNAVRRAISSAAPFADAPKNFGLTAFSM